MDDNRLEGRIEIVAKEKAKRGRKKIGDNTPRVTRKWEPIKWDERHEIVVLLSLTGKTQKEIATLTNQSKEHVWTILNTDRAKEIKKNYVARIRENTLGSFESSIDELTATSLKRMKEVLNNDSLAVAEPFAMFDRAKEVLKGAGKFSKEVEKGNTTNIENAVIFTSEQNQQLISGIDELKQLRSKNEIQPTELKMIK